MGSLVYIITCSLDGYVNDQDGDHDWARPTEEVFAFLNELEGRVQTQLYGRRTYELMTVWETDAALAEESAEDGTFAEWWQQTDKVVYSTTLPEVVTPRTRLERSFDPAAVRRLKEESPGDLSVFGPTLATHAFQAGLVDEIHLFVRPRLIGGGLRALPPAAAQLELVEERRFGDGTVYVRYAMGDVENDRAVPSIG